MERSPICMVLGHDFECVGTEKYPDRHSYELKIMSCSRWGCSMAFKTSSGEVE